MRLISTFKLQIPENRIYGLDILRAMAILFVLNIHSAHFFPSTSLIFKILTPLNLDGVTLFFVLSGFLIGGILINQFEKDSIKFSTLANFWVRRWFRTLPNYFFILVILICLGLHNKTLPAFSFAIRYFYFFSSFKEPMTDCLFPEAWSLNVEEWFYIITPLLIFVLIFIFRVKPKTVIIAIAVVIILSVTCFRYYRMIKWPHLQSQDFEPNFRKQVITRLDSIMYGVVGAILSYYYPKVWRKYTKQLFFLGIALLYSTYIHYLIGNFSLSYICVYSYSIQSIGFLCLFPYVVTIKSGKGFIYEAITSISLISYSLYLINYSLVKGYVIGFLNATLLKNIPVMFLQPLEYLLFWSLSISGAILLYKYIEKPFMALREFVTPIIEKK